MTKTIPLLNKIISFLETKFPKDLAYDWDNVGLQVGDANKQVRKVIVALDATLDVIKIAIDEKVDLIITHHPLIFSPLSNIDYQTVLGQKLSLLIKKDIALYTMHTNYDIADGGMNDLFARKYNLKNVEILCSDGLGRIGELDKKITLKELAKVGINPDFLGVSPKAKAIIGEESAQVSKVAIIAGSGGKYIHEAKNAGADVLITGDVTYHSAVDAKEIGLAIIDVGHFAENLMEDHVAEMLSKEFFKISISSGVSTNPFS